VEIGLVGGDTTEAGVALFGTAGRVFVGVDKPELLDIKLPVLPPRSPPDVKELRSDPLLVRSSAPGVRIGPVCAVCDDGPLLPLPRPGVCGCAAKVPLPPLLPGVPLLTLLEDCAE
jgi:hypothetical protein